MIQNIEKVNSNILSLINLQKDFMYKKELKYPRLFSKEAHTLRKRIGRIKTLLKKYNIDYKDLTLYKRLMNNYKKTFFHIVRTEKLIGLNENDGLQAKLRFSIHILQEYAIKINNNILLSDLYALRKDEKDFMLRKDLKYIKSIDKKIEVLLNKKNLEDEKYKKSLLRYKNYFSELVKLEKKIGLNENSGLLKTIQNYLFDIQEQSIRIENTLILEINEQIQEIKYITFLFTIIVFLALIILFSIIMTSILGPLSKLQNQYKDVVDGCSIVSKTTPDGIITYANDEFCKISGYSRGELIGQNQSIVKHIDTSKDLFKEIWKTIKKDKKIWTGNIKNLKKDGSYYWVRTTIKPILDEKNKVTEYISIRTDITEHEEMKEYFKVLINDESKNHYDAIHKAKEYRKALNKANIISVFNLKYEFTYINKAYCKLTGYSKSDLLGQTFKMIKGPDKNKFFFEEILVKLKLGKSWNGIIQNYTKKNKKYWTSVTYIPIKNEKNEVVEYMGIINDVTKMFTLHKEIEDTQKEIIYKMGEVGESRSSETGNHVKRVAEYSKSLALLYGLSEKESNILLMASPMHDIGKVGIPDSILKKPRKLNHEEFEIMKTHAQIGYNILSGSKRKILQAAAVVSKEHHEKWDGSGYPLGLKKEEIHIYGRITAIADVFDALGSERVYKKAWKDEDIFALFMDQKGKHFDPKLIDLFMDNIDIFLKKRDKYAD